MNGSGYNHAEMNNDDVIASAKRLLISVFSLALFAAMLVPAGSLEAASPADPRTGKLVIPGTGDSQSVLLLLARRFEELHPGTTVIIPDSIGSGGGIRAVSEGTAVIARIARTLNEREREYGLTYRVFATSPVVFAVHPGVDGVVSLSPGQITDIYSGKTGHWIDVGGPPEKIYAIGREPGDSSRAAIEANLEGFGKITTPVGKTYFTTPSAVAAIGDHQLTIGYGPLSAFRRTGLRILAVADISPSAENVTSGRYPMAVPLGLVYRAPLLPLAQNFVDFLGSEDARKILGENACYPVGEEKDPRGSALP